MRVELRTLMSQHKIRNECTADDLANGKWAILV